MNHFHLHRKHLYIFNHVPMQKSTENVSPLPLFQKYRMILSQKSYPQPMSRTVFSNPIRFIHTHETDQLHSLFGLVIHMWIIFLSSFFSFCFNILTYFLMICNFPGLNWLCYRRSLKFNVFALMFRFTSFCERCSINNELVYKYTYRCRKMSFVPRSLQKVSGPPVVL